MKSPTRSEFISEILAHTKRVHEETLLDYVLVHPKIAKKIINLKRSLRPRRKNRNI